MTDTPHPGAAASRPSVEPDVERLHRAILREPSDPVEGREPALWWVVATVVAALFWGGWYLGRYGGSFGVATHAALGATQALTPATAPTSADPVALGKTVFTRNCQACHQATGLGVPGAFPPLVGSEWVTGPPEVVARIVLNGLQGPVQVAESQFNGAMPGWRDALSDAEIAGVLSYVRQWKPNAAEPVDSSLIAKVRAATAGRGRPWTMGELQAPGRAAP